MADTEGISYLRTLRPATPVLYSPDEEFEIGGSRVLRSSSESDEVALIGAGITVHEALKAAGHAGRGRYRCARDRPLLDQAARRGDAAGSSRGDRGPARDRRGSLVRGRPGRRSARRARRLGGAAARGEARRARHADVGQTGRASRPAGIDAAHIADAARRLVAPRPPSRRRAIADRESALPLRPYGRPHRIRAAQGVRRRPALRERLVHRRAPRSALAGGCERRGQDDAPARDRGRDLAPGREARVREGDAHRAPRPASAARVRHHPARVRALRRARPPRGRSRAAAPRGGDGAGRARRRRRLRRYAEAQASSSTRGAGPGATARPRPFAASASPRTTSTGRSARSPAGS